MPITDKRPLKVFLCHAHADRDAVRALYTRLTNDGVDAWLDKEKLLPGQDWELEIKKAVRAADVVVVCLSKQFVQAGTKHKEVKWALDTAMEKPEGEIFIIPARLEECENLENLRHLHWVDLFEDDGYKRLAQTLRLRAAKVEALFEINISPALNISKLTGYPLSGQIGILNNLALTYQHADDVWKAIEYFDQALDLSREIGDKKSQAVIFSGLGSTYWKMKDFSKAKDYFEQSLLYSRELGDRKAEVSVLTNLASTYESVGDLVRATELYKTAFEINNILQGSSPVNSPIANLQSQICESMVFTYLDMPSRTRSHGLRVVVENKNPHSIICKAFRVKTYSPDESIDKYLPGNNFFWLDDSLNLVIERRIEKNRTGTFVLADIYTRDRNDEYLYFVMQEKINQHVKKFRAWGTYKSICEIQGTMNEIEFICPVIEIEFDVSPNYKNKRFIKAIRSNIPKGE